MTATGNYTIAVIGGGIVGLAAARALRQRHDVPIIVLEAEPRLAAHQTGHNSGVVHSGLYYRPGSLKARLCVSGREALYALCREHGLRHERCGKLLLATGPGDGERLDALEQRGRENGLVGLERLDGQALRLREPHARGERALFVRETGIVDFTDVAHALARDLEQAGVEVRVGARVRQVAHRAGGFVLRCGRDEVAARNLLGCAGLEADRVARMCGLEPDLALVPFRGDYYRLRPERAHLVRGLIYPVPAPGLPFLGVHLTRTVHGHVEAGPNAVLAASRNGYEWWRFSPRDLWSTLSSRGFWRMVARGWSVGLGELHRAGSKRAFVRAVKRLVPEIGAGDLVRAGAGVRAQAIDRDGTLIDDFHILEGEHMLHVLNAPSPAATASLSIGQELAARAGRVFALATDHTAPR